MKAEDLTTEHELLMPDKVTWCRVESIRRYGRGLFVGLLPVGLAQLRVGETVTARRASKTGAS